MDVKEEGMGREGGMQEKEDGEYKKEGRAEEQRQEGYTHPSVSTGFGFRTLCRYQNPRMVKSHSLDTMQVPHLWIQPVVGCKHSTQSVVV